MIGDQYENIAGRNPLPYCFPAIGASLDLDHLLFASDGCDNIATELTTRAAGEWNPLRLDASGLKGKNDLTLSPISFVSRPATTHHSAPR